MRSWQEDNPPDHTSHSGQAWDSHRRLVNQNAFAPPACKCGRFLQRNLTAL